MVIAWEQLYGKKQILLQMIRRSCGKGKEEDVQRRISNLFSPPQERVGADSDEGRVELVTKCMCTANCVSAAAAQMLTGQRAKTDMRLMAISLCSVDPAASEQ